MRKSQLLQRVSAQSHHSTKPRLFSSDGEASVELRDEDFHGSVPRRTHAEIKQKVEVEYVVNHPTRMLRSTAAMLPDDWSNPTRGARVLTNGGAIQYFSRDKESIR